MEHEKAEGRKKHKSWRWVWYVAIGFGILTGLVALIVAGPPK